MASNSDYLRSEYTSGGHARLIVELEIHMPRFAAVQLESRPLDPERNLENVTNCLREAASSGAELVVFPECILTGYILTAEEAEEVAEPIPGPRTNALVAACRREGVLGVVGTIERDVHGQCYNSAVLLGPGIGSATSSASSAVRT